MNRSSYVYRIGHLLPAAVGWRFLLSYGSSLLPSLSRFLLVSGNENPILEPLRSETTRYNRYNRSSLVYFFFFFFFFVLYIWGKQRLGLLTYTS